MTSDTTGPTKIATNARPGTITVVNGRGFCGAKPPSTSVARAGPYPHIDDLLRVTPEGNTSLPLVHLLGIAENDERFAKFQASIDHIDDALREYIKASILAVNVIPKHPDFLSLQKDRSSLSDRYNRLKKSLHERADYYEKVKQIIKEDNARTGVQPAHPKGATYNARPNTLKPLASVGAEHQPYTSAAVAPPSNISPSPGRRKPAVQPKPAGLHGNSIKPQPLATGNAVDLEQRFANLRGPPTAPVQDPRIRTRPPPVPIPSDEPSAFGPRDMQNTVSISGKASASRDMQDTPRKSFVSSETVAPVLPKLPDAIYSPARQGSISSEAAELPSSTPRGMYSRSNSSTGFYTTNPGNFSSANPAKSPQQLEFFGVNGAFGPDSVSSEKRRVSLPEGDMITVEELLKYQRIGSKDCRILLIDVRPRAEFEVGHILSLATICIEPDILNRDRIEAADVEDAMEVGLATEKLLFERRHDFDLVVFYDQDSENLAPSGTNAPAVLFRLLTDFDYPDGDPGSKHPKMLKGGLEAWQDAMGGSALQRSSKQPHKRRPSAYDKLRLRFPTKPIQSAEEARRWEQKLTPLKREETCDDEVDDFSPVRSVNDFLTRFPPIQESLSSPPATSPTVDDGFDQHLSLRSLPPQPLPQPSPQFVPILPSEPTRPPPAVPRRSYTGLREPDDDHSTLTKIAKKSDTENQKRAAGLRNPGSWCYANSTLQALFSSGAFGEELMSGEWAKLYKAPKKEDESIIPPQLLTKIIANLFHWMGNAKFPSMEAKTLMDYLRAKSSKNSQGKRVDESEVFGTHRQMDAMEFFVYMFTELDDETNRLRDRPSKVPQPEPSRSKSQLDLAIQYWDLHSRVNDSIIDKYWRALEALIVRCDRCGHVVTQYENKDMLILNLPKRSSPVAMENLLQNYFSNELLDSYKCDNCSSSGCCRRGPKLVRLPDLLCVCLARFEVNEYGKRSKINTTVDFPIRELDMTPYTIQGQQPYSSAVANNSINGTQNAIASPTWILKTEDHHFCKPFKYEAYAVVQHGGELTGGHYISIIRDEPHGPDGTSRWHVADDAKLSEITVGPGRSDKGSQFLHRQTHNWGSGMEAYMVFYQRKGVGLV